MTYGITSGDSVKIYYVVISGSDHSFLFIDILKI